MHAADVTQTVHYLLYKTGVAVSTDRNSDYTKMWWWILFLIGGCFYSDEVEPTRNVLFYGLPIPQ